MNLRKNFKSVLVLPLAFFNFLPAPDRRLYSSSSSYLILFSMSSFESISSLPSSAYKLLMNRSHLNDSILMQVLSISQNNDKTLSLDLLTL